MLSHLRNKYEEENRSRLSSEQRLAAMDAAKAHMRDCVARDDFGGMQRLKSILAGVIPHRMVQFFIDDLKGRWPKLRAEYLDGSCE